MCIFRITTTKMKIRFGLLSMILLVVMAGVTQKTTGRQGECQQGEKAFETNPV